MPRYAPPFECVLSLGAAFGDHQRTGCLKDLKRFWRMDDADDDRNVARILAETNVLTTDLLPILLTCVGSGPRGTKVALACGA